MGEAHQLQPFVLSLSKHECSANPTPSGVARQLVTFSCFAKEKVTKKKATPARRPFGVPSVAQLVRLPHKLARSATRPRAQTYSSEFPDQFPLLGGTQGKKKRKPKPPRGHFVPTLLGLCELKITLHSRIHTISATIYFGMN